MMKITRDPTQKTKRPIRIKLTEKIHRQLIEQIYQGSVSELAKRARLPYQLVYNIVHRRVHSISARHYRMLFGQSPPRQNVFKVDATYFREMADLWLYLMGTVTRSDLYQELHSERIFKKADCRIFSGRIASIDPILEERMQARFISNGLTPAMIRQWIEEYKDTDHLDRIPYAQIRPALIFLRDTIDVNPTFILNQLFSRYESGDLKSVSYKVFRRVMDLEKRVVSVLEKGTQQDLVRLKEAVYGGKHGYTLYSEIEEELKFLKTYAGIGPKRFLGRSSYIYETGKARRIASHRAAKINSACRKLIEQLPNLPVHALPTSYRSRVVTPLVAVLVLGAAKRLSQKEGLAIEKRILKPTYARNEYEKERHGFTQFDRASSILGMKKKAFDLMVAKNCEIFKGIGRYAKRWYLSDLYLKELASKDSFDLITAKYELMAQQLDASVPKDACMN